MSDTTPSCETDSALLALPSASADSANQSSKTNRPPSATKTAVLVIGNGMVSHRFCKTLYELDQDESYDIHVIGEEPRPAYDRVHLGDLFEGKSPDDLTLGTQQWYAQRNIALSTHTRVTQINRQDKTVTTVAVNEQGQSHGQPVIISYDKLVLATGSKPYVPPIEGSHLQQVYVYRTVEDVQTIQQAALRSQSAAVIGGGLLGLEAARALVNLGVQTTLIHTANALMPRQLDAAGASILKRRVEQLGVQVRLSTQTRSISSGFANASNSVTSSTTEKTADLPENNNPPKPLTLHFAKQQDTLQTDMVIIATGITPRDELAKQADLSTGATPGGIIIDNELKTSDPNIYAIGECAIHHGTIYGLVAPGYHMADVLAKRMTGDTKALFTKGDLSTRLKLAGETIAVFGQFDADDARSVSVHGSGMQRTLVIRNNRLIGATIVGAWDQISQLQEAVEQEILLNSRRIRRFQQTGDLFSTASVTLPVTQWPENRLVCNCLKISRGTLTQAVETCCKQNQNEGQPATCSLEQLSACTGAGTVCGSCRPLLAELAGLDPQETNAAIQPAKARRTLFVSSAIALLLAVLISQLKPLPMADSIEGTWRQIDQIWRIDLIKQITGYTLLGLSILALILSARKRIKWLKKLGDFGYYRALHTSIGVLCLLGIVVHTGMRMGHNLNFYLMLVFLSLNGVGALAGIVTAIEAKSTSQWAIQARRFKPILTWAHLLLFWPFPILLGFHIAAVYLY